MSAQPAPTRRRDRGTRQNRGVPTALLGMILFIASEVMFFGGFFGAYFDIRAGQKVWPPRLAVDPCPWRPSPIALTLTILLVTQLFTAHAGMMSIGRGDRRGLGRWSTSRCSWASRSSCCSCTTTRSSASACAGTGIFATLFYTMTGFHFAHVLGGALHVSDTLQARNGAFSAEDHTAVTAACCTGTSSTWSGSGCSASSDIIPNPA